MNLSFSSGCRSGSIVSGISAKISPSGMMIDAEDIVI